uniref:Carboxylic ester hydrolase n=1 Tax=Corethrella appendiculata TaxID=1370023 RepID=U5EY55_9DIPT
MKQHFIIFILIIQSLIFYVNSHRNDDTEDALVKIDNGLLRGEHRDYYYAFEGVPYAEPPIGKLRYQPPVSLAKKWKGEKLVTKATSICIQWDHFIEGDDKLRGEEDCLYLNIYTPTLDAKKKLPVVFNIHGGAFMFGYGHFYGPEMLLQKQKLVYVTINYRLGPMGFLSSEDDIIPGNFGLKDQTFALKWVKENIGKFGGDPNAITVTGFSAGGASTHLQFLTPLSKGLFQRGIAHSGSALCPWVFQENAQGKTRQIAENLGCKMDKNLLKCLQEKPAADIVRQTKHFQPFLYNPFSPFGVVVEKKTKNNPHPFITDSPAKLMERGEYNKYPILFSAAEAEGLYPSAEFMSDEKYLKDLDERWNELMPNVLDFVHSVDEKHRIEIAQLIREHYLQDKKVTPETFGEFTQIISDRLYNYGIGRSAKLMQPHSKVFVYFFRYKAKYGVGEAMSNGVEDLGVAHGDDIFLIFNNPIRDVVGLTRDEINMARKLTQLYLDFARNGEVKFGDVDALPMDCNTHVKYLEIVDTNTAFVKVGNDFGNSKFWESIDKINEH